MNNSVNSVNTLIHFPKWMGNTEPSFYRNVNEGVTTMAKASTRKCGEAQNILWDDEIVYSCKRLQAAGNGGLDLTNQGEYKGTYYLERRMVTSVRQPFAGIVYRSTATAGS